MARQPYYLGRRAPIVVRAGLIPVGLIVVPKPGNWHPRSPRALGRGFRPLQSACIMVCMVRTGLTGTRIREPDCWGGGSRGPVFLSPFGCRTESVDPNRSTATKLVLFLPTVLVGLFAARNHRAGLRSIVRCFRRRLPTRYWRWQDRPVVARPNRGLPSYIPHRIASSPPSSLHLQVTRRIAAGRLTSCIMGELSVNRLSTYVVVVAATPSFWSIHALLCLPEQPTVMYYPISNIFSHLGLLGHTRSNARVVLFALNLLPQRRVDPFLATALNFLVTAESWDVRGPDQELEREAWMITVSLFYFFIFSSYREHSPELACHAMWQCKSHAPGLSGLNAMARKPFAGIKAVSLRGGLSYRNHCSGLVVSFHGVLPCPRTTKSLPCRCIGWGLWCGAERE